MTPNARASVPGRAFGETLGFAALAAVLYAVTWQSSLHGTDWRWFVLWLDEPGAVHPQHPGYLLVAHAVRWLLSPFEPDAYGALAVVSIAGGSVAVAGLHRAAMALADDRWFPRVVALLVMVSPALWHHATVVELHAPFAAVMAWASWLAVRQVMVGGVWLAVLLGAVTGVATLMHATGHLLVLLVAAAIAWRCRERGWRWGLRSVGAFGLAHGAAWGGLFLAIRASGRLPRSVVDVVARAGQAPAPDNPVDYLLHWWQGMDFSSQIGPTGLHEWLEPYAPASVLFVLAFGTSRFRGVASLFSGVLVVYLVATVALVHAWTDERGGYLLPLLFPAVLLSVAVVPQRLWAVLLVATLASGIVFRGEPDRPAPDRAFGAAAAAMAHAQPTVFFVADLPEMDGAFLADPRLDLVLARKEYDDLRGAAAVLGAFEPAPEQVTGWLAMLAMQARDRRARFVITDRAVSWLSGRVPAFEQGFAAFAAQVAAERLPPTAGIVGYVVPRP